jgi:hypothetical protein
MLALSPSSSTLSKNPAGLWYPAWSDSRKHQQNTEIDREEEEGSDEELGSEATVPAAGSSVESANSLDDDAAPI